MRKPMYLLLFLTVVLMSSCDREPTDRDKNVYYQYNNKLSIPISIDYYWTSPQNECKSKTESAAPGEFIKDAEYIWQGTDNYYIRGCDSIRIVFNKKKELWYFQFKGPAKPRNVFNIKNYKTTEDTDKQIVYEYDIDEEVYALATDIE